MNRLVGTALVVLVLTSAVQFFSLPVADNDLWGHVFFGQEILSEGALPETNRYSYTAPDHPWINHEILAEVSFAAVFDRFGSPGLLLLKLLLGLVTLAFLARAAFRRTDEPAAVAVTLVAATSLMSFGYMVRPQLFTFLCLAVTWDALQARTVDRGSRLVWILPGLFVLWVNTHGGVLAGVAVLGLYAGLRVLLERDRAEATALGAVFLACAGALFVNPYGADLPVFLFRDVLIDRPITEWAPIPLFDRSNLHFKAAVLVLLVATLLRRGRPWWETPLVALAAVAAFRHERHLPLFAILATPLLAEVVGRAITAVRNQPWWPRLSGPALALVGIGCLAIAGQQLGTTAALYSKLQFGIYVSPDQFPVRAVRFIDRAGLSGNLALPFDWGEYAIWHLYPKCRVSVDGRYTTAYPDDVLESAWHYMEGSSGWEATLEEADFALASRHQGTAARLSKKPGWRLAYADTLALVFVRQHVQIPELPPDPERDSLREILFP